MLFTGTCDHCLACRLVKSHRTLEHYRLEAFTDEAVFDSSNPSNSDDEGECDSDVISDDDSELNDIDAAMEAGGSAVPALSSAAREHSSTDSGAAVEGQAGADSGSVQDSLSPAAGADGRADAGPNLHLKPALQAPSAASQAADKASGESSSVQSSPAASRAGTLQGSSVGSRHSRGQGAGSIGSSRALSEAGQSPALAAASPEWAASGLGGRAASPRVALGAQLHDSASESGDDLGGNRSGSGHRAASQHSRVSSEDAAASQHRRASGSASPSAAAGQGAASQSGGTGSAADPGEGRSRQAGRWLCCGRAASSAGSQSSASECSAAGSQTSSSVDWVREDYMAATESIAAIVNMLALHGAQVSQ